MINYDEFTKENIKYHNRNWSWISDNPYRILIFGGSRSGKTNALPNLIKQQDDDYSIIDKVHLCYRPTWSKISTSYYKIWKNGIENLENPRFFLNTQIIYRMSTKYNPSTTQEYNPSRKCNVSIIVFDDIIADMITNKNLIQ